MTLINDRVNLMLVICCSALISCNKVYGRHPRLPIDVSLIPPTKTTPDQSVYRATLVKNIAIPQEMARKKITANQEIYKAQYDKNASDPPFQVGDKVYLHDPTKKRGLSRKLREHFIGPCVIKEQLSPVTYRIGNLPDPRMCDVVHSNRLKLIKKPHKHSIRHLPRLPVDHSDERPNKRKRSNTTTQLPSNNRKHKPNPPNIDIPTNDQNGNDTDIDDNMDITDLYQEHQMQEDYIGTDFQHPQNQHNSAYPTED